MRSFLIFTLLISLLSCNTNTGNFINYTLEADGTPEQVKETHKALLARLERLKIGGDGFESRIEGNRIYLKLPENKYIQENPGQLRNHLQHRGQLTFSEVYENTVIYSLLFDISDSSAALKAFNQRLFQIMQPQTSPDGNSVQPGPVIGFVKQADTLRLGVMLRDTLPELVSLHNTKFMFAQSTEIDLYTVVAVNSNSFKSIQPVLETVELSNNDNSGSYYIDMKFTPAYSSVWAKMTRENIGRTIAIIVDGQLYSYPTVSGEITGGQSNITGNFDKVSGEVLVNTLRNGYSCTVKIIEESHTKSTK
jgi:preprotein translocase subunit SecD